MTHFMVTMTNKINTLNALTKMEGIFVSVVLAKVLFETDKIKK